MYNIIMKMNITYAISICIFIQQVEQRSLITYGLLFSPSNTCETLLIVNAGSYKFIQKVSHLPEYLGTKVWLDIIFLHSENFVNEISTKFLFFEHPNQT